MLNLTKEILAIEQTNLKLPQDEDSLKNINNNNIENNKNNSLVNMSGNELSPKKNNNQNSNKDIFTERKQLDGEEVLVHAETMLRFEIPFKYETYAIELIENFYIKDHPYFCDIKELCGKELLTRWKASHTNRRDIEEIIETYFKEAIQVGLKCLPVTNIYLANISLDVGTFYAVRGDYLNAVKIFNWAYVPFKKNSQYFLKDYCMYLKRFIKYNIKLGDFRMAIALGEELLKENPNFRNEKDTKT
jgi:tetratricopeptide (TPR) repeat protein